MYQEIHPYRAITIDSVQINISLMQTIAYNSMLCTTYLKNLSCSLVRQNWFSAFSTEDRLRKHIRTLIMVKENVEQLQENVLKERSEQQN